MAKAYKYQGILGRPTKSVAPPLEDESYNPFDEEHQAAVLSRLAVQREALIDALFADCGIDRDDVLGWQHVALKLAERHVKAFQPVVRVGRKRGPLALDEALIIDMMKLINSGKTISNAAAIVAKRCGDPKRRDAIETHYHRTMKDGKHALDLVERWARQLNSKGSSVAKSRG
jgi:hypothetical protein